MKKILFYSLVILFCGVSTSLSAQQSKKISLQGFLKDANGKAVADGMQEITFKLYTDATTSTVAWEDVQNINVFGGVYSTHLGSVSNPVDGLNWGASTYYVGVTVQGIELTPRTELTFAPYSLGSPKAQEVVCSGAVGDVKYSILNPTQFATVNGDCWVPMTGGSMNGSALGAILGNGNIPDAGGLFIRAQETAGGGDHDPDRTPTSPIATFEDQTTRAHSHPFSGQTNDAGNHNHGGETGGNGYKRSSELVQGGSGAVVADDIDDHKHTITSDGNHSHTFSGNTDNNGGNFSGPETRPKNMNLYIYIRIN